MLFTDIEGSTRLLQLLGPAYGELLARHHAVIRGAIAEHSGDEVETAGDAFFVVFDRATDAVCAAVAIQRALGAAMAGTPAPFRVRMGLHAGDVALDSTGYVGMPVHEAARVAAAAHGGQVLASDAVRAAAEDLPAGIAFDDLGEHALRDIVEPIQLFQVAHPDLATDFPPPRTEGSARHNLPAAVSSFVGRDREVAEVRALVASSRLVTVTGTGGLGKTRIAVHAAAASLARFPAGTWFVDLTTSSSTQDVVTAIARTLDVPQVTSTASLAAIARHIGSRRALLVLDNCEQVLAGVALAVDSLLSRCPALTVLATSREPLGVTGETAWRLPVLAVPAPPVERAEDLLRFDAVRLFVERARAADTAFVLDERTAGPVARVCRQVDGIPLALELAAARLQALSLEDLAQRLDERFRILRSTDPTAAARHQTLEATLDWSHDLLTADEATVFRRLAVFPGDFSLDAADAIASFDVGDGLEQLAQLVRKSLVVTGGGRYRMLETIREYARRRLEAAGEVADARKRHAEWYVSLAETAEPALRGGGNVEWRRRLAAENDNLDAAMDWSLACSDGHQALTIAGSVWWSWVGSPTEAAGLAWLDAALNATPVEPRYARVSGAIGHNLLSNTQGRPQRFVDEAVELATRQPPDPHTNWCLPWALTQRAAASSSAADPAAVLPAYEHAVRVAHEHGHPLGLGFALAEYAVALERAGRHDEAVKAVDEAVAHTRRLGSGLGISRVLAYYVVGVSRDRGDDPRTKRATCEELVSVAAEAGDRMVLFLALMTLAHASAADEDAVRAYGYVGRALEVAAELHSNELRGEAHFAIAWWEHRRGDVRASSARCNESLSRFAADAPHSAGRLLPLAALLAHSQGDAQRAARLIGAAAAHPLDKD
ncbi:MAG TPA: adenylate/guanylate cyclase domain-containing protein, partial [Frankiaceae bacterium]|nr:adenylate/guanylate cyclase domain-containing protein [Frankiaceae bacterium]